MKSIRSDISGFNPILDNINYCVRQFISFFFQAEDGIRDHCVTGVQTCALPICWTAPRPSSSPTPSFSPATRSSSPPSTKIGRASCRERVYISVIAEALKKKKYKQGKREQIIKLNVKNKDNNNDISKLMGCNDET